MDDNVLVALDDVRLVLRDEHRPDEAFYAAAGRFLEVFHAEMDERGMSPAPLDEWDPRPDLMVLEGVLIADDTLDTGLFAAAKTVRDSLDHASRQMAAGN